MSDTERAQGPRLTKFVLTEDKLREILRLGPDASIVAVDASGDRRAAQVVVHDPNLAPIPLGAETPIASWYVERVVSPTPGLELVAAERQRQVEVEGYTPAHDADHEPDALALAGACYATPEDLREYVSGLAMEREAPTLWPFSGGWKPTPSDRLRELVKATALLLAEIDRQLDTELAGPPGGAPGQWGPTIPGPGQTDEVVMPGDGSDFPGGWRYDDRLRQAGTRVEFAMGPNGQTQPGTVIGPNSLDEAVLVIRPDHGGGELEIPADKLRVIDGSPSPGRPTALRPTVLGDVTRP